MSDEKVPVEGWDVSDVQSNAAADAFAVQMALQSGESLEEAIRWYGPLPGSAYEGQFYAILKSLGLVPKTPGEVLRGA